MKVKDLGIIIDDTSDHYFYSCQEILRKIDYYGKLAAEAKEEMESFRKIVQSYHPQIISDRTYLNVKVTSVEDGLYLRYADYRKKVSHFVDKLNKDLGTKLSIKREFDE